MQQQKSVRNNAIDIFRYIGAVFVISIHTAPFQEYSVAVSYLVTQFLARIAVPFFFVISGYFYLQKLENNKTGFWIYLKGLLKKYTIWSILYFGILFWEGGYAEPAKYIQNCLNDYFVYGSYYHFWFFPAVAFAAFFSTVFFKAGKIRLLFLISAAFYVIGCLGCSYYGLGIRIPGLEMLYNSDSFQYIRRVFLTGIPFFVSGYGVYKIKGKIILESSTKKIFMLLVCSFFLWIAELMIIHRLRWVDHTVISFGLYVVVILLFLVALVHPMPEKSLLSRKCRFMAGFAYCAHPAIMILIDDLYEAAFGREIGPTLLFLFTVIAASAGGLIVHRLDNKHLNVLAE